MEQDTLMKANENYAERDRLGAEIVNLMTGWRKHLFYTDERTWRVVGNYNIKGKTSEKFEIVLTQEDINALIAVRDKKVEALAAEFEEL